MDLQAIGCVNKAGLEKNEQIGLVSPKKDGPQERAADRNLSQDATMRKGPGNSQTSQGGRWAPLQAGRQAVGERQVPNLRLTLA